MTKDRPIAIVCVLLLSLLLSACGNTDSSAITSSDAAAPIRSVTGENMTAFSQFCSDYLGVELPVDENGQLEASPSHSLTLRESDAETFFTSGKYPESFAEHVALGVYSAEYTFDLDGGGPASPITVNGWAWLAECNGERFYFGESFDTVAINGVECELMITLLHGYENDNFRAGITITPVIDGNRAAQDAVSIGDNVVSGETLIKYQMELANHAP